MSASQFIHANLDIVATVSHDGKHISRIVSFDDGTRKQLGCFLGGEESSFEIGIQGNLAQRLQITQGNCLLVNHDGQEVYLREGQSFVVSDGANIFTDDVLQYILHLEG